MAPERVEFPAPEPVVLERALAQGRDLLDSSNLRMIVDAAPVLLFVLNQDRQVVFANRTALQFLGAGSLEAVCGRRPGELLNCVHALSQPGGCGAAEPCEFCGVRQGIFSAHGDEIQAHDCRLSSASGQVMEFRIWTLLIRSGSDTFTLLAILDVSDEKRRRALERIFFHDIANTAAGFLAFSEILHTASPDQMGSLGHLGHRLVHELIEQINTQKDLAAAECGELHVHPGPLRSVELLQELRSSFSGRKNAFDRTIRIDGDAADAVFQCDKALLRRVLGNMLNNALEASAEGDTVTIGCDATGQQIVFWVHNAQLMSPEVQFHVFNRSFSTKDPGRGLGTYGIRLLTERYLKGQASFTSTSESGTVFRVALPLV